MSPAFLHTMFYHFTCFIIMNFLTVNGRVSDRPKVINDVITIYSNYRLPTPMQKVVVRKSSGDVYVSGRNTVYLFDTNLKLKGTGTTGPVLYHPECLLSDFPCSENRTLTDSDTKVLLIEAFEGTESLVICTSLDQGSCTIRSISEIHRGAYVEPRIAPVAFVAGRGSTVAFFAKGYNGQRCFYSAATYDDRPLIYSPPSVSSRVFTARNKKPFISYAYKSDTEFTGVNFAMKQEYKVDYIMGFAHGDFAYFLTTQQTSVGSEDYETRLARICTNDPTFFSYTEVPILCNNGSDDYNLATAAGLGIASDYLKQKLNLDRDATVLYVSFVRTVPGHGRLVDKTKGSLICSFPMSTVESSFTNATEDCFKGEPWSSLLTHVTGMNLSCNLSDIQISNDFCGSTVNKYIAGGKSISGAYRTNLTSYITSLAFLLQNKRAIAVAGTDEGEVIKVDMDKNKVLFISNIAEDQDEKSIQSSNAFDLRNENIYLLTGNKVVKFPIGFCSVYLNCSSCLSTEDALDCGWCGDHCARFEDCTTPTSFTKNVCAAIIYDFFPKYGPTEGGTLITVNGDNFGEPSYSQRHAKVAVSVGGLPCDIMSWKNEEIKCKTAASKVTKFGIVQVTVSIPAWLDVPFDLKGVASSEEMFTYLIPVLYGIYPEKGPMSGGTNITLKGNNLSIGLIRTIKVAGIPCNSSRIFKTTGWCVTRRLFIQSSSVKGFFRKTGPVQLIIDNAVVEVADKIPSGVNFSVPLFKNFQYLLDPEIYSVSPNVASISSARNLTVKGRYLDSVNNPIMIINIPSTLIGNPLQIETQSCTFNCSISSSETSSLCGNTMICQIPELKNWVSYKPTKRAPLVTQLSFLMDGVEELKHLPMHDKNISPLLFYPDPEYQIFETESLEISLAQTHLKLTGKNLNLVYEMSYHKVMFDDGIACEVESLTIDLLTCVIPDSEELRKDKSEHFVTVFVGPLTFLLGKVNFLNDGSAQIFISILTVILGIILLVCLLASIFVYIKRSKRRKLPNFMLSILSRPSTAPEDTCSDGRTQANNANYDNDYQDTARRRASRQYSSVPTNEEFVPADDETLRLLESENILVSINDLTVGDIMGQGQFGFVYKGELQLPNEEGKLEVAVKVLQHRYSSTTCKYSTESFLQEGLMMKDFHHNNVLRLIGICFQADGAPMIITPFMKYGDLLSHIRNEDNNFTVKDFMTFGIQIATGMSYLAEIRFVHRDLAARNCMLDDTKTVKVADFGLSRDIYERDYYSTDSKMRLPIRWMAPESIEKGSYTSKSDVWSFGVLLWELLTRGISPYPGVDNWDIMQYIKLGRRLPQPSYCPNLLYSLMLNCWEEDPKARPSFHELQEELQAMIAILSQRSEQKTVGLDVTYINLSEDAKKSAEKSEPT